MEKDEVYIDLASNSECNGEYLQAISFWLRASRYTQNIEKYIWIRKRLRKCKAMV
ncbi:hypothetical protein FHU10_1601 [Serratia fonticola]|uniref:ANR family transcriptional regulator n=1 Tax=Serratia fonticola TaxID=47917 RepID=A0A542BIH3_SERFO|nr:hypothetical protein FHU09_0850 [Serratia fonticola]TQI99603.1 hypothetical protein FHU11_5203 [Serratia fonticola]TVZ69126.1 hypothetical protein FHU10_1601 [Serratia fonticola]